VGNPEGAEPTPNLSRKREGNASSLAPARRRSRLSRVGIGLPTQLPSLRGRRADVVRVLYILLAVAMTLLELASLLANGLEQLRDLPTVAHYSISIGANADDQPAIRAVSGPARAAGVVPGSRILAIQGSALPLHASEFDAAFRVRKAVGPLVLDLADKAGHLSRHSIARLPDSVAVRDVSTGMNPIVHGVAALMRQALAGCLFLIMSLLLFRERPRDPEAVLLAFSFLLLMDNFSFDTWLLDYGVAPWLLDYGQAYISLFGWYALLIGLCGFPDGRFVTLWSRIAILAPTFYVTAELVTNFSAWQTSLASMAIDVPILSLCAGSVVLRYRHSPPGIERQQIKWAALGAAVMILGTLLGLINADPATAVVLGPAAGIAIHYLHDTLITFAFPVGLLVSVLRFRLYDADLVITRSAGYTLLTAALVAIFACTEKVIEVLGEEHFGHSLGALAGGLGAAVAAVMIAPLHHRIMHWAEHRFRKGLVHLRHGVPLLMNDLRETAPPPRIAQAALDRCHHALNATRGAIVLHGRITAHYGVDGAEARRWLSAWPRPEPATLEIERHAALFPLRMPLTAEHETEIGWLLLGPRPDGSLYGRDERETLREIADPIARALTIARLRAADKAALVKRLDTLEAQMVALSPPLTPRSA